MLSPSKIADFKDQIDIVRVAEMLNLDLKKEGQIHSACCPIHKEKTPSFKIFQAKKNYKCFGCGAYGDAISLVEEIQKVNFIEACKWLASRLNIHLQFEEETVAQKAVRTKRESAYDSNKAKAHRFFKNLTEDHEYLIEKGWSKETRIAFGIGLATEGFFKDRIVFPITDDRKRVVGFTCRDLTGKALAKYLNSKEDEVYRKRSTLYGLYQVKQTGSTTAEIMEGSTDVISAHDKGYTNAMATCGTSFTEEHCKLLKRHGFDSICFTFDGDKAGMKALAAAVLKAVKFDFKVSMRELFGEDPDDILSDVPVDVSHAGFPSPIYYRKSNRFLPAEEDGLTYIFNSFYCLETTYSPIQIVDIQRKMITYLAAIKNELVRSTYFDVACKVLSIKKSTTFKKALDQATPVTKGEEKTEEKFKLTHEQENHVRKWGFFADLSNSTEKRGYWFDVGRRTWIRETNFTIEPLFHKKSDEDSLLVKINNGSEIAIVDMPIKALFSYQDYKKMFRNQGDFHFKTHKPQYINQINNSMSAKFPVCKEIEYLGWQKSRSFYAFSDGIAKEGEFHKVDEFGMVELDNQHYFLPAHSSINADKENDEFENERFYKFHDTKYRFEEIADLMDKVYSNNSNGRIGVLYLVASLFRDLIYNRHKFFPHLFLFGKVQSGKSQLGWTLNNVFCPGLQFFNLHQGTYVGFNRKLGKAGNTTAVMDEFDQDLEFKKFQLLKSAYDGIGHEKGVMGSNVRTAMTAIRQSLCIIGQHLPTQNGNSLFSRSIVLSFSKDEEKPWTQEEIELYTRLKKSEEEGLSHLILEITKHRKSFEKSYAQTFDQVFKTLRQELKGKKYDDRVLQNFAVLLSSSKILMDKIKYPFTFAEALEQCKEMILDQTEQMVGSEGSNQFWLVIKMLIQMKVVRESVHYKIAEVSEITVKEGRKEAKRIIMVDDKGKPKKVLYIYVQQVWMLYLKEVRTMEGVEALDQASLKDYLKSSKAYLGNVQTCRIGNDRTSALAFEYDKLPITLVGGETHDEAEATSQTVNNQETDESYKFPV